MPKKSQVKKALALLNAQLAPKHATLVAAQLAPPAMPPKKPVKMPVVVQVKAEAVPPVPRASKSVISRAYKQAAKTKVKDWVSLELEEVQLSGACSFADVARDNGFNFRWAHLNVGMQRMNLGNVLRGMRAKGFKVTINGRTEHATLAVQVAA